MGELNTFNFRHTRQNVPDLAGILEVQNIQILLHKDDDVVKKNEDYVYGISVYKALIYTYIDIWKGYYTVKKSLLSGMKPWTEPKILINIYLLAPSLHIKRDIYLL